MRTAFDKITLDADEVHLDGHLIDGSHITPEVIVRHRASEHDPVDTVTITIAGSEIKITDAVKAFAKEHGTPTIEIYAEAAGED